MISGKKARVVKYKISSRDLFISRREYYVNIKITDYITVKGIKRIFYDTNNNKYMIEIFGMANNYLKALEFRHLLTKYLSILQRKR